MTCNLSQIRKQLDDLQKLMEAQQERNKPVKDSHKKAIEIAIRETKAESIEIAKGCLVDPPNCLNDHSYNSGVERVIKRLELME